MSSGSSWGLLRARAAGEATTVLSGLRGQVEVLAQGQATVQQALTTVQATLGDLQARLAAAGADIKDHLARDIQEARRDLQEARSAIHDIRTAQTACQQMEDELRQAVGLIEAVMAGRERRGEAGEQIVAAALRLLPASMVEQGFKVNGKVVEFALVLPGGHRPPITALTQIERHLEALDRTLENSAARAITMLENAYGDLKRGTGDLRGALAGLRQPPQGAPEEQLT